MAKESELAEAEIRKREQLLADERSAKERIELERQESEARSRATMEKEASRRKLELEAELAAREAELTARAASMQDQVAALQSQLSGLTQQEKDQRRTLDDAKTLLEQSRQLAADEQAKQRALVATEEQKMREITSRTQEMERRLASAQEPPPAPAQRASPQPTQGTVILPDSVLFVHEEKVDALAKGRLRVRVQQARFVRDPLLDGMSAYLCAVETFAPHPRMARTRTLWSSAAKSTTRKLFSGLLAPLWFQGQPLQVRRS